MGFSLLAYCLLAITGGSMSVLRLSKQPRPAWLRPLHYGIGAVMVGLVLLLLGIGIVGTLGHYGTLGHSLHLLAGTIVVGLVLTSVWSASYIGTANPWARSLHLTINGILFIGFVWVSLSGWDVVQKYLP